jgi:hypothetical protein
MDQSLNKIMDAKNYTLKDAITVYMLPFSFSGEYGQFSSLWKISSLRLDDSAFYPHIYRFLTGNFNESGLINPNNCVILSLKDNWDHLPEKDRSNIKIFGKTEMEIKVNNEEAESEKITFKLLNEKSKLSSPKLILSPLSNIGVLILSIELTEKSNSLNDLINLNYKLHKINLPPAITLALPPNAHPARIHETNRIYDSLSAYSMTDSKKEIMHWYLHSLCQFLLHTGNPSALQIQTFNKSRFHLFTYFQVNSLEEGILPESSNLMKDFIRIARCQNQKYQVLPDDLGNNTIFMQTFENIYIASCVEGAAMMIDSQDNSSEFIKTFKNTSFLTRYLWIYLLVFLQRYTLIELTGKLMNIDTNTAEDSKENLWQLVRRLSKMKINSYFTDLSEHTQHNAFYRFCSERLLIQSYLDEIKDKIDSVDVILREQIEKNETAGKRRLEWILTILMLPEIFFAAIAFYQSNPHRIIQFIPCIFIIPIGILIWLFASGIAQSSKQKKKRRKKN